jgi:hypothetical protein
VVNTLQIESNTLASLIPSNSCIGLVMSDSHFLEGGKDASTVDAEIVMLVPTTRSWSVMSSASSCSRSSTKTTPARATERSLVEHGDSDTVRDRLGVEHEPIIAVVVDRTVVDVVGLLVMDNVR